MSKKLSILDSGDTSFNSAPIDYLTPPGAAIVMTGGAGIDFLYGGAGNDTLFGGGGNDYIYGGAGNDLLVGGQGDDFLYGGAGADWLAGDVGWDTVSYAGSAMGINVSLTSASGFQSGGDAEGDHLIAIENVIGSNNFDIISGHNGTNTLSGGGGRDQLYGKDGDDRLLGGDDWDYLVGGRGADVINGGAGIDTASYIDSAAGVWLDLSGHRAFGGDAAGDFLIDIENLVGSIFDDKLIGDNRANLLEGLEGNDFLEGGIGDDRLLGLHGDDRLRGGAGNDYLSGGLGFDIAEYDGPRGGYSLRPSSDGSLRVVSNTGGEVDTLSGIEAIVFGNTIFFI